MVITALFAGATAKVKIPMPSSTTVVEDTLSVVAKPVATAAAPVTAVPVVALVTVNCEAERVAIVTPVKLNGEAIIPVAVEVVPVTAEVTVKLTPALTAKIVFAPLKPVVVAPEIVIVCPAERPVVEVVE
jgi:hypothetical protein